MTTPKGAHEILIGNSLLSYRSILVESMQEKIQSSIDHGKFIDRGGDNHTKGCI